MTGEPQTRADAGRTDGGAPPSQPDREAPAPPLAGRVVRGAGWVFAGRLVGRGLGIVKVVVLARLLSPEDFGLFGIVMLAIAALQTFTVTGFNAALIHRKEDAEDYLDTAWTVHVLRGLVLAAALFAAAPAVGWFFAEPRAIPLLRVMCASVVLGGLVNIGTVYFQKKLEFHKQVVWQTASSFAGLVVGVVLAYRLRSVWALVWAGLAAAAVRLALSYVIHPYRPRLRFDRAQANELFRFGKWLLGSSVVVFVATHGDDAFLGKMLGAGALGLYQVAYRLSNAAATEIAHVTSAVMRAAYAQVQDQRDRLARGFLKVFEGIVTLTLPLTVFLIAAAPDLVRGLLGPKWEAAIVPIRILALAGFLRSVTTTGGPLFAGTGRPHLDFWMNLGMALTIAATVYPLTVAAGVAGTSASVVLGYVVRAPIWASGLRSTGLALGQLPGRFVGAIAVSVAVLAGVLLADLLPAPSPAIALVWKVAAAALAAAPAMLWVVRTRWAPELVRARRAMGALVHAPNADEDRC